MLWAPELIARLKKYVDANNWFQVQYRSDNVFGLDLAPEGYEATRALVYLEEYDDCPPDGIVLEETKPGDFHVFLKSQVNWQAQDPNWSSADPETWDEYQKGSQ